MCVDKNHFTCCCCYSLTSGTIFIGIFNAILSVGYALEASSFYTEVSSLYTEASKMYTLVLSVGFWVTFSFSVVLTLIPLIVICNQNNSYDRKGVFWIYMIVTILKLIIMMAFISYFFANL